MVLSSSSTFRADGRKYRGQWFEGKQHGKGTFIKQNGEEREGEWVEGKRVRWITSKVDEAVT